MICNPPSAIATAKLVVPSQPSLLNDCDNNNKKSETKGNLQTSDRSMNVSHKCNRLYPTNKAYMCVCVCVTVCYQIIHI